MRKPNDVHGTMIVLLKSLARTVLLPPASPLILAAVGLLLRRRRPRLGSTLVLIGLGQPETFPDCKLFGISKTWRSATPFVPTRHGKTFRDGRPKIDPTTGWQTGSEAHDLFRLFPVMHERHRETKGIVFQLHYQGLEPRPIVRFQSVLPFGNPTAQRPTGLDVTGKLEQRSLLQFQVAFD